MLASAPAVVPTRAVDTDKSPATAKDDIKTCQKSDESPGAARSDSKSGDKDKERGEVPSSKSQDDSYSSNGSNTLESAAATCQNTGPPADADAEPAFAAKPSLIHDHGDVS